MKYDFLEPVLFRGRAWSIDLPPVGGIALVTSCRLVFHSTWGNWLFNLTGSEIAAVEPSWKVCFPKLRLRTWDGSGITLSTLQPFKFRDAVMQMLPPPTPSMLIFLPALNQPQPDPTTRPGTIP